jgi:Arc-like DNA binding dprotein
VSEVVLWRRDVTRKVTDTVQLKLRFSERLRRQLERAAKHNEWSMNTEIVDRLDVSFQREIQEKEMGSVMEQTIHDAVTKTVGKLVQELRQSGLIPDQMARPQEATEHPAPPDKEEHSK